MMPNEELQEYMYNRLYLIRSAENKIIEHYLEDEMKTPMHMSKGGEAIPVGVLSALGPDDPVTCTYRTHAVYLTKTGNPYTFFKELYGKVGGTADGKAGSMHLVAPDKGLWCSTAIVGTNIPVGLGIAFADKMRCNNRVTAIFFGDGAVDEGVFWESLNIAMLMKLPVLFIYEDNGYAVHSPVAARHSYRKIGDVVRQIVPNFYEDDSNSVEKIYDLTQSAMEFTSASGYPSFLHFHYYRYLEHVGVFPDFDAGYRSEGEACEWYKRDPVALQRGIISSFLTDEYVESMEDDIDKSVCQAIEDAKKAEFPGLTSMTQGVVSG